MRGNAVVKTEGEKELQKVIEPNFFYIGSSLMRLSDTKLIYERIFKL